MITCHVLDILNESTASVGERMPTYIPFLTNNIECQRLQQSLEMSATERLLGSRGVFYRPKLFRNYPSYNIMPQYLVIWSSLHIQCPKGASPVFWSAATRRQ